MHCLLVVIRLSAVGGRSQHPVVYIHCAGQQTGRKENGQLGTLPVTNNKNPGKDCHVYLINASIFVAMVSRGQHMSFKKP